MIHENRYNANFTAKVVEWEGSCQRGICEECSIQNPMPTIPTAHCDDGRSCLFTNRIGIAPVGILSMSFLPANNFQFGLIFFVGFMGLLVLLFIPAMTGIVVWTRIIWKKEMKRKWQ